MFAGFSNDARAQYPFISQFESWRIITASTDQMIASTALHANGAQAQLATTGANVSMSVQLGDTNGSGFGGVGGTGNHLVVAKCDVAEVLVYDRVLSQSEREQIESYLSSRYTIPLVACAPPPFTDDFESGNLSPLWLQVGNCGPAAETGGGLVLSKPSGCGSLVTRGVVGVQSDPTYRVLCGDFDVQVDFDVTNLSVPSPPNACYTGLLLKRASDPVSIGHVAAIERFFQSPTDGCTPFQSAYKFFGDNSDNCLASWVQTSDVRGKLRMLRAGGEIIQLYWNGSTWVLGRTAPITTEPLAIVLYIGTTFSDQQEAQYDNLLLRTGISGVSGQEAPKAYELGQNRPNPFNPETVIPYSLGEFGNVTIRVYDPSGRCVRTLVNAAQAAGQHKAEWAGELDSGLMASSGVYFYRITYPNGSTSARKMTILR